MNELLVRSPDTLTGCRPTRPLRQTHLNRKKIYCTEFCFKLKHKHYDVCKFVINWCQSQSLNPRQTICLPHCATAAQDCSCVTYTCSLPPQQSSKSCEYGNHCKSLRTLLSYMMYNLHQMLISIMPVSQISCKFTPKPNAHTLWPKSLRVKLV